MIYLNNAATSFPKFKETSTAIYEALLKGNTEYKRSSVANDNVERIIFDLREKISSMLHAEKPHYICFTNNDTMAINFLIMGYCGLNKGDIILTDKYVHNSVSRPLIQLEQNRGVKIVYIENLNDIKNVINKYSSKIKFAIFSHGSNVTGDVLPLEEIGKILKDNNIHLIVDVAQTFGAIDINVEKMNISALTFAGHKLLVGPQGTGGFYIRKKFPIKPIVFGGTGNSSMELNPQVVFPDSFEVGTPAIYDLIGLFASLRVITEVIGEKKYAEKLRDISVYAYKELQNVPNIILYGNEKKELPVISFNIKGYSAMQIGQILAQNDIVCRTGVHCASKAIEQLNVIKEYGGTVRVSFGWFTTKTEIDSLIKILKNI